MSHFSPIKSWQSLPAPETFAKFGTTLKAELHSTGIAGAENFSGDIQLSKAADHGLDAPRMGIFSVNDRRCTSSGRRRLFLREEVVMLASVSETAMNERKALNSPSMNEDGRMLSAKRKSPSDQMEHRVSALYSSKIIKAGALIGDTKTLLSHWDSGALVAENLDRIQRDNVFGKASRSRVEDILAIFRQRYLAEECVTKALVSLVWGKFPVAALERILYFHSARADPLLHDAVSEILLPMHERGLVDINVQEFQRSLTNLVSGKISRPWSDITMLRAVQSILATLRDFGVLQGAMNKKIAPSFLPTEAFAYIVFYLKQHQPSGVKVLELPDWKLFFLSREGVERSLFEAHQRHLLEYHVAGTVTRLTFPANNLEEYADVLAQR